MAAYGDTFFFDDEDDAEGHLHMIVTEPTASGEVITVSITTRHKTSDAMVPLEIGDHPYITRPSVVAFAYASIRNIADINALIANRDAKAKEPMEERFLRRTRAGLLESDRTPYEVQEFYRGLERYENERQ